MRVNPRKVLSREKTIKILRNVFSVTAFAKPFQRECIGAWTRMREGGKLCQWLIQLEQLQAENARLKEERRWIPVSERLPEDRSWAIVKTTDFTEPLAVLAQYCNGNWWWFEWRELQLTVTHWMPLPEPPQEVNG